jgi:hypothetical protein
MLNTTKWKVEIGRARWREEIEKREICTLELHKNNDLSYCIMHNAYTL